jgi:hypothetical protein
MGCCGKARANLSVSRGAITPAQTPVSGASRQAGLSQPVLRQPGAGEQPLMLRYLGQSGIVVRGAATGRQYAFSAADPVRCVNLRDAAVLLRTSYFRQA